MSKNNESKPCERIFPALTYYNGSLIVDKAWVNAREKTVLVEIEGKYFEIDLDTALGSPIGKKALDQCELVPVGHGPSEANWPLGQGGHDPIFRFSLRDKLSAPRLKTLPPWRADPDAWMDDMEDAMMELSIKQEQKLEKEMAAMLTDR